MPEDRRDGSSGSGTFSKWAPHVAALEPLDDMHIGVGRDFAKPSTTMLLVFSGMPSGDAGPPPFEFTALTSRLPAKRLFVRDVQGIWYQHGVPGFGRSIDEVVASLRLVLGEQEVKRLVVCGYSAGGYAALLFGTLLQADLVVAFAPQSFLDREWLASVGDDRWDRALDLLESLGGPDDRYVDLRAALSRDSRGGIRYDVHYDGSFPADAPHAARLAGIPGLELYEHPSAGFSLIRSLRVTGDLSRILRSATQG
jgi:pimeloyl-ACP methyl ester carboxylesterase